MNTITILFVRLFYFFATSKRYHRTKEFTKQILEYPNSKLKFYFDLFMVCLVVLSVLFLLYEVKNPDLHPFIDFFIDASFVIFTQLSHIDSSKNTN